MDRSHARSHTHRAATVAAPAASERQAAAGSSRLAGDVRPDVDVRPVSRGRAAEHDRVSRTHRGAATSSVICVPGTGVGLRDDVHLAPRAGAADLSRGLRQAARDHRPAHRCREGRDRLRTVRGSTVRGFRGGVDGAAGVHDHRRHRPVRRGLRERDARPRWDVGPDFGFGSLERVVLGVETWTGTLTAPGIHFTAAQAERSRCEDGARGEGCEERPRDLRGDGHRRRGRRRSRLVLAEVGKPFPARQDDRALRGDGRQRQHRHGGVHGDREATAMTKPDYPTGGRPQGKERHGHSPHTDET